MSELVEQSDVFQTGTEVATQSKKWELKKLTARHKKIAALKAQGLPREDIAKMCQCTPEYVTMLMQQPLMQQLMTQHHAAIDQDLQDLTGKAVDKARELLESGDDKVALGATTLVLKANGKLGKQADPSENVTAEDVIQKFFQISNSNVQINIKEG